MSRRLTHASRTTYHASRFRITIPDVHPQIVFVGRHVDLDDVVGAYVQPEADEIGYDRHFDAVATAQYGGVQPWAAFGG